MRFEEKNSPQIGLNFCKKMMQDLHYLVTPLSQNGLVRVGRGLAVGRSSRLVPAYTALGDQKYKALSILRIKKWPCGRKTTVSTEQKISFFEDVS